MTNPRTVVPFSFNRVAQPGPLMDFRATDGMEVDAPKETTVLPVGSTEPPVLDVPRTDEPTPVPVTPGSETATPADRKASSSASPVPSPPSAKPTVPTLTPATGSGQAATSTTATDGKA